MTNIDKLINKLENDLEPVKTLPNPLLRAVVWFFAGLISVVLIGALTGFRMDLPEKIKEPAFVLEMLLIVILSASAAYASAWLSLPDGGNKIKIVVIPYVTVAVALLILGKEAFEHGIGDQSFEFHYCIVDAMIMGIVPIILMVWMMRQGAPTRPVLSALTNLIAAGAIGYLGLRLTCGSDTIGHVCMYHIFPFLFIGLLLGLIARRLYRW